MTLLLFTKTTGEEPITKIEAKLDSYWDVLIQNIPRIAISVIVLMSFVLAAMFLSKYVRAKLHRKATDSITANFVIGVSKFILIAFGIMLSFHALGLTGMAGGMLAGAGASAVIIGFAFKEIGENFLAGIILVFDRPFNIGNTVTINDNMGVVVGLRFRTTQLKAFDGRDIYIPNSCVIQNNVINHTEDGLLRHEFLITDTQSDDIESLGKLIEDTLSKHPEVLKSEKSQVLVDEINKNEITYRVQFWINTQDYKYGSSLAKSKVMMEIRKVLLDSGRTDISVKSNSQAVPTQ